MLEHPFSYVSKKSKTYFFLALLCFSLIPIAYTFYSITQISSCISFIKNISSHEPLSASKQNFFLVFNHTKGILFSFLITQLLHYIGGIFFSIALSESNKSIKDFLFKKIQSMPLNFFQKYGEGEIEKNISSYAESFCKTIELLFYYTFPLVISIISTIIKTLINISLDFLFYTGWIVIFGIVAWYSLKRLNEVDGKLFSAKEKSSSFLIDLYKNILVEKAFQIQNATYMKFLYFQEQEEEGYRYSVYKNNKQKAYLGMMNNLIFVGYIIFILLFSKDMKNLIDKYNLGWNFNLSLWRIVSSSLPLFFHLGCLNKATKFFEYPEEDKKHENIQDPHRIEVKNLLYKVGRKEILKNINFSINHEIIIIKGFSGSGKSTILSILAGLTKCSIGTVFIDGKDITSIDQKFLLDNVNFLTQHSYIFNDSIKNNITIANLHYTEEQFEYAIEKSKVVNFTKGNIQELNRICGPSGSMISGGQAKRIALARLLIKDKGNNVILLDEPFAHLDTSLITFFISLLQEFKEQKRSVIIIDHTNSCDALADQIIYLDDEVTQADDIPYSVY